MRISRRGVISGIGATTASVMMGMPSIARTQTTKKWVFAGSSPLTGPFAQAGTTALKDITDWVEMTNDTGGVAGLPVEIVHEDSGYDPARSLANFKKAMSADQKPVFYFGDSTGFMKLVAPELLRTPVLNGGSSFASELANPSTHPYQYIAGPTYQSMFDILLQHIKGRGGKTVGFVYSDTEFGRDPIEHGRRSAASLGLEVVHEEVTKAAGAEIQSHVSQLRRANPEYVILHGFVTGIWPEVIATARAFKMETQFLGTVWGMEKVIADAVTKRAGPILDGYAGVMPYRYFYEAADTKAYASLAAFKKQKYGDAFPGYVLTWSLGPIFSHELAKKSIEMTVEADKAVNAANLAAALASISNWDSGGYMGRPVSVVQHSVPQGRIYSYDADSGLFDPVSEWMEIT
jgi:branched-chain amino acid transport system substrate-binding protein